MLGLRQTIEEQQIYATLPEDCCQKLTRDLESLWKTEQCTQKQPSLFGVIRVHYMREIIGIGLLSGCLEICCRLVVPQCLGGLIVYFGADVKAVETSMAYAYAAGLIGCSLLVTFTTQSVTMHFLHLSMRLRVSCSGLIYGKTLRLATSPLPAGVIGYVLNLMSTDVQRMNSGLLMLNELWRGPVELLLMGYMIYAELGMHGLLGCAVLLAFLPMQAWLSQSVAVYRKRTARHADVRLRIVGEVVRAIQVIKMYTWERWFAGVVDARRK